MCILLYWCR